jgi:hypothetical protein
LNSLLEFKIETEEEEEEEEANDLKNDKLQN